MKHPNNKIDLLAFDIFDTIIFRKVHPETIKKIAAKRLKQKLNTPLSSQEIYQIRHKLEAEICQHNASKNLDLDFNFKDFLLPFHKKINSNLIYPSFKNLCQEIELHTELSLQYLNPKIHNHLQKKLSKICISDFYLPKFLIREMLRHHNIDQHFRHLFISSEYLLTKRSGRLYGKVLETIKIPPQNILMIGDNYHSDHKMAQEKGFQTLHLRKDKEDFKISLPELKTTKFESNIQTNLFPEMATTLYFFIENLHNSLLNENAEHAFFISKEGQFLKTLFDTYQEINNFNPHLKIKTHYFLASRKSTFLPSLQSLPQENFQTLFRQYRQLSIDQFLQNLNFSSTEIEQCSPARSRHQIQADLPGSPIFKTLLKNPNFQKTYESKRLQQRTNFLTYLQTFPEQKHYHFIDVGWKGTIQDHIQKIINKPITGHYLGLIARGNLSPQNHKKGILFSNIPEPTPHFKIYNHNRPIFEIILNANHGSTLKYEAKGPHTKFYSAEKNFFHEKIQPIQKNILKNFIKICDYFHRHPQNSQDLHHYFAKHHARLVHLPTPTEEEFISKAFHHENFGSIGISHFTRQKKLLDFIKPLYRKYRYHKALRYEDRIFTGIGKH